MRKFMNKDFVEKESEFMSSIIYKPLCEQDWILLKKEIQLKRGIPDGQQTVRDVASFLVEEFDFGKDNETVVRPIRHLYDDKSFKIEALNNSEKGFEACPIKINSTYYYEILGGNKRSIALGMKLLKGEIKKYIPVRITYWAEEGTRGDSDNRAGRSTTHG